MVSNNGCKNTRIMSAFLNVLFFCLRASLKVYSPKMIDSWKIAEIDSLQSFPLSLSTSDSIIQIWDLSVFSDQALLMNAN